ncbi:MAG: hypothetical protein F4Y63_06315 [Chloroflexi bacterium]|nr:hypothetical protein [Chloroflexota bacterium]MYK61378.1 hypothetical protein [Chloroflexota bacterium]
MTSSSSDQPLFTENLRAPGWMFAFLGLMLGAVSGGLTAVGIRGFTDDPLISGGESLIFYVSFTIAIVGIVYVMLNSTLMETKATADDMTVRLGVLGTQRTFDWNNITAIRTANHNIARHGGRGNPFAPSTRRSWTMYGVRSGVEIQLSDSHDNQIIFISSSNSDELVAVAERHIA